MYFKKQHVFIFIFILRNYKLVCLYIVFFLSVENIPKRPESREGSAERKGNRKWKKTRQFYSFISSDCVDVLV